MLSIRCSVCRKELLKPKRGAVPRTCDPMGRCGEIDREARRRSRLGDSRVLPVLIIDELGRRAEAAARHASSVVSAERWYREQSRALIHERAFPHETAVAA